MEFSLKKLDGMSPSEKVVYRLEHIKKLHEYETYKQSQKRRIIPNYISNSLPIYNEELSFLYSLISSFRTTEENKNDRSSMYVCVPLLYFLDYCGIVLGDMVL